MTNHDELLDQYIDALNAGRRPNVQTNDAKLADLFRTADLVHALSEPEWPQASFVNDMAARLASDLAVRSNGHVLVSADDRQTETLASNPWVADKPDATRLEPFPPRQSRIRQSLQIAGALAAFAVFAMVLIMVFREDISGVPAAAPPVEQDSAGTIAFSAASDDSVDIFVAEADGSGLTNLTNNPSTIDSYPAWSPDGSRIAFSRGSSVDGIIETQVFVMSADGTNQQQITDGPGGYSTPVWSPDGSMIAALQAEIGADGGITPYLVVMTPDGTGQQRLTNGELPQGMPSWTADSKHVAVEISLSGVGPQILLYPVDGGEPESLHMPPMPDPQVHTFASRPSWSPDGSQLALMLATDPSGWLSEVPGKIAVAEDNRFMIVADSEGVWTSTPSWSPDSRSVVLSGRNDAGAAGIFLMVVGNANSVSLLEATSSADTRPSWSPDGEQLAFIRSSWEPDQHAEIIVANVDGTEPVSVSGDLDVVMLSPPSWRPDGGITSVNSDPSPRPDLESDSSINLPTLQVQHAENVVEAVTGSFNWVSLEEQKVASVTYPFIDVGEDGMTAAPGDEVRLTLPDGTARPDSIVVSLYPWQGNNAIPAGRDGNIVDRPWFIPTTESVSQQTLDIDDPTFKVPNAPTHLVAHVEARWPDFETETGDLVVPVFVNYAVNLYVTGTARTNSSDEQVAIEIVRQFLLEPDADVEAQHQFGNIYQVQHAGSGTDKLDTFSVDVEHGYVRMAMFEGRSSLYLPSEPIDEDMAAAIAEHHLWMWAPRFDEMTLYDSSITNIGGDQNNDRMFSMFWQTQDEATGAWIPPRAWIQINMETSQVYFFNQSQEEFGHSTVPTLTSEQAEAIALDHAAETLGDDVTYVVESVELHGLEDTSPIQSNLAWQVQVTPRSSIVLVDAHTGEIATTLDYSGVEDMFSHNNEVDEPGTNENLSEPEESPRLTIEDGIEIVRDYLGDLEAALRASYQVGPYGDEYIWVQHDIGSETQYGEYQVDSQTGEIVSGGNPLTSTPHAPEQPITDEQALQHAWDFVHTRFADMSMWKLIDDGHSRIGPGTGDGDRLWTVRWHGLDPETGVMLPSRASVVVNTRTGLVYSWNIQMIGYDGPMVPEINEQQVRDVAIDSAAQAGIESPVIASTSLAVQAFPGDKVRLVWSVAVENQGDSVPDVAQFTIDAITGVMLDQMGEEIE